jgi:hypothetical protein
MIVIGSVSMIWDKRNVKIYAKINSPVARALWVVPLGKFLRVAKRAGMYKKD